MTRIILLITLIICHNANALEKCTFFLDKKYFKIGINFFLGDERLEQKGFFTDLKIKGNLYGNSIRDIIKNIEVLIPYKSLNTYSTQRDRTIYNFLLSENKKKQDHFFVKIKNLERNKARLEININNITKNINFKYDSRDVSMQSIGYIDLADFKLLAIKGIIQDEYNKKIWNDIFIDVRAKFTKNCEQEL